MENIHLFLFSNEGEDNAILEKLVSNKDSLSILSNFVEIQVYKNVQNYITVFGRLNYNYLFSLSDYKSGVKETELRQLDSLSYRIWHRNPNTNKMLAVPEEVDILTHFFSSSTLPPRTDTPISEKFRVTFHCFPATLSNDKDRLEAYFKEQLRKGKIVFWGRLEEVERTHRFTNLSFIDDLRAALRSKVLSRVYQTYHNSGKSPLQHNWTEKILNSMDHGVTLIDPNFYILSTNKSRRILQRNNILGKTCFEAFGCSDENGGPCADCRSGRDLDKIRYIPQRQTSKTVYGEERMFRYSEVRSPCDFTDEFHRTYKLNVSVVRNIDARCIIDAARKEINSLDSYDAIQGKFIEVFEKLGFKRIRYYEAGLDVTSKDVDHDLGFNVLIGKSINHRSQKKSFAEYQVPLRQLRDLTWDQPRILSIKDFSNSNLPWIKKFHLEKYKWFNLPLIYNNRLIGVIQLDNQDLLENLNNEMIDHLTAFSDYLTVAINNIKDRHILKQIIAIEREINQQYALEDLLFQILKFIGLRFNCFKSSIFQYVREEQKVIRRSIFINFQHMFDANKHAVYRELSNEDVEPGDYITGWFVKKNLEIIKEYGYSPYFLNLPRVNREFHIFDRSRDIHNQKLSLKVSHVDKEWDTIKTHLTRIKPIKVSNMLLAPLIVRGKLVGCIRLTNNEIHGRRPFSWLQQEILSALVQQISVVVERVWAAEKIEKQILRISDTLKGKTNLRTICDEVCRTIKEISNSEKVIILLKDEKDPSILRGMSLASDEVANPSSVVYRLNHTGNYDRIGISAYVAITGKMLRFKTLGEIRDHPAYSGESDHHFDIVKHTGSAIYSPISVGKKRVGVIRIQSNRVDAYSEEFYRFCRIMVNFVELAVAAAYEMKERRTEFETFSHEMSSQVTQSIGLSQVMDRKYARLDQRRTASSRDALFNSIKEINEECKRKYEELGQNEPLLIDNKNKFLRELQQFEDIGASMSFNIQQYIYAEVEEKLTRFRPYQSLMRIVGLWSPDAKQKHCDIDIEFRHDLRRMVLDSYKSKFELIVYNLISNAVKYSYQNTTISVCGYLERNNLVLTVENMGYGIEQGDEELIFNEGFRGENVRNIALGLGKGLPIIINTLNNYFQGTILLKSLKEPTMFEVLLPTNLW